MTDKDLGAAAGDIFAKAFTLGYKTGRTYIPTGGMALTAEQVEDVEALVVTANPYSAPAVRLRALFPATEPAEERRNFPTIQDVPNHTLFHTHGGEGSSLFVRNQSGDLRLCLNAGPEWSKLMQEEDFPPFSGPFVEVPWSKFPQSPADPFAQPAPAEPAEEVTKAERRDPDALAKRMAWIWHDGWDTCGERERDYLRRAAEMAHSYYFSSPVVPAPTETEWATVKSDGQQQNPMQSDVGNDTEGECSSGATYRKFRSVRVAAPHCGWHQAPEVSS